MRRGSRMRSLAAVTAVLAGTGAAALAGTGGAVAQAAPPRAGMVADPHAASAPHAAAAFTWHRLKLLNGWKSASTTSIPAGTPSYAVRDEVVYLNGAIKQPVAGSEEFARLPAGSRPAHTLWMQVLTGTSVLGTLRVFPDGLMSAYNGGATTETSMAMVSFPTARIRSHALTIGSGWESGQSVFSSGNPAYAISHGVVYLSGSLEGTEADPPLGALTLPRAARPKHSMFLTVYTFSGSTGTLVILPTGQLDVYGSEAPSFTSLAGISYPVSSTRWHDLKLYAGWTPSTSPAGAGHPAYAVVNSVIFLTGGAQQPTPGSVVFAQLPRSARPKQELSGLTYAGDEGWAAVTSHGHDLYVFSNPAGISQTFTSLAGLSYPLGA
jgi:hypothetical protein